MNSDPYYIDPLFFEREKEKNEIRGAGNRTAAAFLIMTAIMVFWSYPLFILAKKFNLETCFLTWIKDDTLVNVFQIIISSVAFIFPYVFLAKIFKIKINDALQLKPIKQKKQATALILIGLSVCSFINIVTTFAGNLFENMGFSYEANINSANPNNIFGIILTFIATAVTPAIVEEFAMRGILLTALRKYGDAFAILISSVIFGLMHGNFEQIPFAFMLGIYLGFITVKTSSILPAMLLHFLNNALSVVMGYLSESLKISGVQLQYPVYFLLLFIPVFFGIYMLSKEKDFFELNTVKSVITEKTKIISFLTAPAMIVVWVAVMLEALFVYA